MMGPHWSLKTSGGFILHPAKQGRRRFPPATQHASEQQHITCGCLQNSSLTLQATKPYHPFEDTGQQSDRTFCVILGLISYVFSRLLWGLAPRVPTSECASGWAPSNHQFSLYSMHGKWLTMNSNLSLHGHGGRVLEPASHGCFPGKHHSGAVRPGRRSRRATAGRELTQANFHPGGQGEKMV